MKGLLGLVVLVLDIWAIIKIAQSSVSTGMKLVWILVVLFLPVIGLLAWYFVGPKK